MRNVWIMSALLLGFLMVLPGASCVPTIVLSGVETDDDSATDLSSGDSAVVEDIISRVNDERQAEGLDPLVYNELLTQAAQAYAQKMADEGFFAHEDPDTGDMPWDRASAVGYTWTVIAENIAAGQSTTALVMDGWMHSEGHRANILSPAVTEIGVGLYVGGPYGYYWVQLFGHP